MDILLSKVTQQAMNYAIRTGITITSGYAIRQCGRLLRTVDGQEKSELAALQLRLESKIRIISPAIDMIELIAARGNTSLESAVTLTKSLRFDIQSLGVRLAKAVGEEQLTRKGSSKSRTRAQNELELKLIITDIKNLLVRIEDAVPLINLAITTSGVNLSTTLPATVSPSRLLQASTFLTAGDTQYAMTLPRAQQIGPAFTLSMYMLFSGHAHRPHDEADIRETTWKEVMHKARVKLLRVPLDKVYRFPSPFPGEADQTDTSFHSQIPSESKLSEFAYQLVIIEDFDDDRLHTFEDESTNPGPYEGVDMAGVREVIPIHEISKIFYADTGKILNIGTEGETNNPILLLKRDINAVPPRKMMDLAAVGTEYPDEPRSPSTAGDPEEDDEQTELDEQLRRESTANLPDDSPQDESPEAVQDFPWRLPPNLDLEWMAFEVYTEEPDSESEIDESELDIQSPPQSQTSTPQRPDASRSSSGLLNSFSKLNLQPSTPEISGTPSPPQTQLIPSPEKSTSLPQYTPKQDPTNSSLPPIKTSLSLLEMLVRLTALQQFQQSSHLAIPDELLTFFLSESSTVGAGGDSELRRRVRREARLRVGFDPYDESPIKRRGEEYLEHEFHDADGYDGDGSGADGEGAKARFDYEGFPHGRAASPYSRSGSRASTPGSMVQSPSVGRSRSAVEVQGVSKAHGASASPLLRRATTQPQGGQGKGLKQPSFRGAPLLPHRSSSAQVRESVEIPDTPPTN